MKSTELIINEPEETFRPVAIAQLSQVLSIPIIGILLALIIAIGEFLRLKKTSGKKGFEQAFVYHKNERSQTA